MSQEMSNRSYCAYLGLIAIVGTSLRLWDLDGITVWSDEIYSAREAINVYQLNFIPAFEGLIGHVAVMLGLLASGADLRSVDPGDFGAFRAAGITPAALRLVPALIGSLSVPLLATLSRKFLGVRQSLVLALLLAIAPWHLYWSQSGRFYVTQFLFYTVAFILYYEATEAQSLKKLVLAMFFFVCAFNVQYTSFVFIPIMAADWLISRLTTSPVRLSAKAFAVVGFAIACCAAMPLLLLFVVDTYLTSHFGPPGNPPWHIAFAIVVFVHPVAVLTAFTGSMTQLPKRNRWYLLMGAFLPIVVMSALSFRSYSGSRYAFVCLYPMLALCAAGIVRIYDEMVPKLPRPVAALPFLLVFGTYLLVDVNYYAFNRGFRPQWAPAADFVRSQYVPGEKVAVSLQHVGSYLLEDLGDDVVMSTYQIKDQDAGCWVISTRARSQLLLEESTIQWRDLVQSFQTFHVVPRYQVDVWYRQGATSAARDSDL